MSWEDRGGRRYYTRSRRAGGRIVREYLGTGPLADLSARHDAEARERRAARAAAERAARAEAAALEALVADVGRLVDALAGATLRVAGYRRHHRGEWRRRRGASSRAIPGGSTAGTGG